MRADLRRAAVELAAVAKSQAELTARRLDPFLQLLERVRQQLEGEVALGLGFQGSFSQTTPKDPVVRRPRFRDGPGACFPALARRWLTLAGHVRGSPRASPRRLTAAAPTKDHILESACGGARPGRLRRRRPPRYLSGDGRRAHRRSARALHIATRSIATSADGSSRTCRSGRAWTLAAWGNGVCAGDYRRRRPAGSLRDELGPERLVPQPR